eukprot:CAMPEP_0172374480 /NCGR_PEP_ID=MMETSP1060-20121228/55972_1 /TAXON_ID=37318 /ORGANISM="Pseudo-nitzschia pungens, Strain cf. cingulata" /LENGTH=2064 /DNA_ID=CAMNT_0013101175 /DNA_START=277 /DNA_END=6471 /DNA_ORIENTATION=+
MRCIQNMNCSVKCSNFLRTPANKRSLKTQLFSSFGLAAFCSLFAVAISSCFVVYYSGEKLIGRSRLLMYEQVENRVSSSVQLFSVAGRAKYVEECTQILVESVRDRIAGYPTMNGWETGKYVPFESNVERPDGERTKKRMYPLNEPPVPLDFQISRDIEVDGIDDPSIDWRLKKYPEVVSSTKTSSYKIPGRFETEENGPSMSKTMDALKDDALYQTTGDLSVMLKSMFETFDELLMIEINFFEGSSLQFPALADNSSLLDSGTYVTKGCDWTTELRNPFTGKPYATKSPCHPPGTVLPLRRRHAMEDETVGDAMQYTATQFAIAAKQEQRQSSRTMEDSEQLTEMNANNDITKTNNITSDSTASVQPNNSQRRKREKVVDNLVKWSGPVVSSKHNETNVLKTSKAIFDRVTNEFIGVIIMEILESKLAEDLKRRTLDDDSDVYLIFNDENNVHGGVLNGLIVGSTPGAEHKVHHFFPAAEFEEIKADLQRTYFDRIPKWEEWRNNPATIQKPERLPTTYFTRTKNGGFLASVPVPPTPEFPWNNSFYDPMAFAVQKINPNVFGDFYEFEDQVKQDVKKNIILCISLSFFGLVLILSILAVMTKILTRPLTWITIVARKIINNSDCHTRKSHHKKNEDDVVMGYNSDVEKRKFQKKKQIMSSSSRKFCSEDVNCDIVHSTNNLVSKSSNDDQLSTNRDLEADSLDDSKNEAGFVNFDYNPKATKSYSFTLSTELQQLLEAFQSMIHDFSGDGVSEVAKPGLYEIRNSVTWHSDFAKLYESKDDDSHKRIRQVSNSTRNTTTGSADITCVSSGEISNYNTAKNEITSLRLSHKSNHQDPGCNRKFGLGSVSLSAKPIDEESLQYNAVIPSCILNRIVSDGSLSSEENTGEAEERYTVNSTSDRLSSFGIYLPGPPPGVPQMIVPAPIRVNVTSTLGLPAFDRRHILKQKERACEKTRTACNSRLFWCIVVLMALPVFVTNCIVGSIVSSSILVTLPRTWKESAKQGSNNIERDAMQLIVDRKAAIIANTIEGPARDIYILSRTVNWLVFGGIQRSDNAVILESASETCKAYQRGECPYAKHCSNNESLTDFRYLQKQWFEVQKLDSNPVTGERMSSPSLPTSPESTLWWKNVSDLPGSEIGPSRSSGYDTLYNRVVVSSASAIANLPIYNHASGLQYERTSFGAYVAFAVDGLLLGWSGCDDWHSYLSNFVSNYENGASLIDDKLCANGKYGYDPRCQDWYVKGRDRYLRDAVPAHITPLYKLPLRDQIAQTITSPITNPRTGEYVGQVALDFRLNYRYVLDLLDGESALTFMITPHEDILGGDTVFFSKSDDTWASMNVDDHIFKNEPNDSNRNYFNKEILPRMKSGERGNSRFYFTNEDGLEEEICLYYAPVKIQLLLGLEPDDFASGRKVTEHMIYSLGAGKPCDEIKRPYDGVEDEINDDQMRLQSIFVAIIVSSTMGFIIFSVFAAIYIAFPMIKLSNIVKNTKKGEYDSIPPLEGGCSEVQGVYNTFAKLNKIVKISNTCFFSGKLDTAHHFVNDALSLYRKINDRKAIGVTCNNLANTLFAIQYESVDDINCCGRGKACRIKEVLSLYNEATGYSKEDFDATEGELKVSYAIQLADRLFNRGLYFLFIDGYDCAPEDARERGYNDITFSRNLHYDIRDSLLENKQLFATASAYFDCLLRRINCLAAFYDDIGLREIWDARILLDEASQLASAANEVASRGKSCPLFKEVNCIGRQQQLESLEILLAMNSGDFAEAAKIGMRMLVEDLYLLESAFVRAAESLLVVMKEGDDNDNMSFSKRSIECTRDDIRAMVKCCKKEWLDMGKNGMFVFEIFPSRWRTASNDSDQLLDHLNIQCLQLYDNFFQTIDQIGILANNVNDTRSVDIGSKEENEGRQRSFLDFATSSIGSRVVRSTSHVNGETTADACFPIALQMLIESSVSLRNDSYIVWVTDGCTRYDQETIRSLSNQIVRLNQERDYKIHLLVIGLNCLDDSATKDEANAASTQLLVLEDVDKVSKNSMYFDASSEEKLASAFQRMSEILPNSRTTSEFISFLTMEKF